MTQNNPGGHRPPLDDPSREQSLLSESDGLEANRQRKVQVVRAGSLDIAIFQDEIATLVTWREPAPLPYAPKSVLGVVNIQGRMLTVLDLAMLLNPQPLSSKRSSQHIVALRGDEQLALAVDAIGGTKGISDGELKAPKGLFLGVFKDGNGEINVLNTKELFATALHGRERRRRSF